MTSISNKKSFNLNRPYYMISPMKKSDTEYKSGSTVNNIKSSLISGLSSGVGFSVADRLVSTVLGPRKVEVQSNGLVRSPDCDDINKLYKDFLSSNKDVPLFLKEAYDKCNSFQS